MRERIVKPEILDHLDPSAPSAKRSRMDLRRINWFMKNERWILSQLDKFSESEPNSSITKIVELGAGDGHLTKKIKVQHPDAQVIACDLIDKPNNLTGDIIWKKGDIFNFNDFDEHTVVVANLFIHHLTNEQLWELSEKILPCRALIMAEPHRYWFSKLLAYLTYPFINSVTRHDMMVSIDAGFRFGELACLLHLDWHWDERASLGGIHSITKRLS